MCLKIWRGIRGTKKEITGIADRKDNLKYRNLKAVIEHSFYGYLYLFSKYGPRHCAQYQEYNSEHDKCFPWLPRVCGLAGDK